MVVPVVATVLNVEANLRVRGRGRPENTGRPDTALVWKLEA